MVYRFLEDNKNDRRKEQGEMMTELKATLKIWIEAMQTMLNMHEERIQALEKKIKEYDKNNKEARQ